MKKISETQLRFAKRAGAALGLAYAMYDAGAKVRDVKAQLREAKAFVAAERAGV